MTTDLKAVRPPPRRVGRDLPPISASLAATEPADDRLAFVGNAPLASVPEPPPAAAAEPPAVPRSLVLSVTIMHRGRMVTISSEGRSLDAFCDLLDARLGVAS